MPTFSYVAKRGPRETIEGHFEAESRAQVLSYLADRGYVPVRVQEVQGTRATAPPQTVVQNGRVSVRHLNQFTRQFASLARSQVPLLRALGILKEQAGHVRLQRIVDGIQEDIRQGQTLSESLAKYPRVFSTLYVSLTRSGEMAGVLDQVLEQLAALADRDDALRSKMQAALAYPLFVGVVGIGTVIFLLTFVMPRLLTLFTGFGGRLPLPTRLLLAISHGCQQGWVWGLVVLAAIAITAVVRFQGARIRVVTDWLTLRLPLLGGFIRKLELARFARSFGMLLHHGVPIIQATEVAVPVVRHRIIRQELATGLAALKEGSSLTACLNGLSVSTPFVVPTVAVGEEGGKVADALMEIAKLCEREIEQMLQMMAGLLEPVMILAVGAVVGFIVMAVLLPIFELNVIAR